MNNIIKVSDIKVSDIADYLRIVELDESTKNYLQLTYTNAKSYISNYTGVALEYLDNYSDFVSAVFVLCQDMYDNRSYYVENINVNNVVQSILDMHSINLLPNAGEEDD